MPKKVSSDFKVKIQPFLAKNGDEKVEDKPAEEKTEEKAENGEEKKEEEKSEEKGNWFWAEHTSNWL